MTKHFVIATAGHVDHGKSALVKALTGTDPDRLPEEKARQITIDLGFAELNLPGGIHAGIVDVPGHEDFVRNMIAGVGSIDLALFVVATDDGWMPQSEEHLQILTHLGVKRAVIAVTKMDSANIDIEQIRNRLSDTPFAQAPRFLLSAEPIRGRWQVAIVAIFALMFFQRFYSLAHLKQCLCHFRQLCLQFGFFGLPSCFFFPKGLQFFIWTHALTLPVSTHYYNTLGPLLDSYA